MAPPPIYGKKPDVKRTESVKSKEEEAPKVSTPAEEPKDEAKPEAEVTTDGESLLNRREVNVGLTLFFSCFASSRQGRKG